MSTPTGEPAARAAAHPRAPMMWSSPVAGSPREIAEVRRMLTELLRRQGVGHLSDDVCIVATELLGNAFVHAPEEQAQLTLSVQAADVRVEVVDAGGTGAVVPRTPSLEGRGGFGLHIVDALSSAWGVHEGPPRRVWAVLTG